MTEALLPKIEAQVQRRLWLRESLTFLDNPLCYGTRRARRGGVQCNDLVQAESVAVIRSDLVSHFHKAASASVAARPGVLRPRLDLDYADLKTPSRQTAAGHGRKKIANDCVDAGFACCGRRRTLRRRGGPGRASVTAT